MAEQGSHNQANLGDTGPLDAGVETGLTGPHTKDGLAAPPTGATGDSDFIPPAAARPSPKKKRAKPETMPEQIGHYRIIRELGRGGMGIVYLAVLEDAGFKRRAALKVIKRGMDSDEVVRRFSVERQVLSALNHPNIALLYDGGSTEDGRPWFALEYVEGVPIDQYCDRKRLDVDDRLKLFKQVCAAVQYAHRNLVVHRDLKPINILVTEEGVPKLLDFGIAKLLNPELAMMASDVTAPEVRIMTPEYASPEQVRGEQITTASDVYSLGVLLYELLTGHRPHRIKQRTRAEVERVVCEQEAERPSTVITRTEEVLESDGVVQNIRSITPETVAKARNTKSDSLRKRLAGDLDNIMLMALAKEPHRRYSSPEHFADDIDRHLTGLPVSARPSSFGYRAAKYVRRNKAGVAIAALVALSTLGVLAVGWQMEAASAAQARADAAQAEADAADARASAAQTAAEAADARAELEAARAEQRAASLRNVVQVFLVDFDGEIRRLPGATPVREKLVTTALNELKRLEEEAGSEQDVQFMRELAGAYVRVGDVQGGTRAGNLGDTPSALASYQEALRLREAVVQAYPDVYEYQHELIVTRIHVADLLSLTGNLQEATEQYEEVVRQRERLLAEQPDDPSRKRLLTIAQLLLGRAHGRTGDRALALESYLQSLELRRQLYEAAPDNETSMRDLSVALNSVAYSRGELGDREGQIENYLEALALRRRLHEMKPDATTQRDLMNAHSFTGDAYRNIGEFAKAKENARAAYDLAMQRIAVDPSEARSQRELTLVLELMGNIALDEGDGAAALESFEQWRDVAIRMVASDPANSINQRSAAKSHEGAGKAFAMIGSVESAAESFRAGIAILTPIIDADPDDASAMEELGRMHQNLGKLLLEVPAALAESKLHLERARALFAALHEQSPGTVSHRLNLADVLASLAALSTANGDSTAAARYEAEASELRGDDVGEG